jgi:endonuclease/exonuclease/phosphatase (EEP) superfamily protein YafD
VNISDANHDHERMLRYLERQQVEVLILLEVTATWAPVVRRLERDYPYQLINVGTGDTGIAMLSREAPVACLPFERRGPYFRARHASQLAARVRREAHSDRAAQRHCRTGARPPPPTRRDG